MDEERSTEWVAWAGLCLCSFAILEHRAIRSARKHPTLSRAVAKVTRRSRNHQALSSALMLGGAAALIYHFNYERTLEDGTFVSYVALDKLLRGHVPSR